MKLRNILAFIPIFLLLYITFQYGVVLTFFFLLFFYIATYFILKIYWWIKDRKLIEYEYSLSFDGKEVKKEAEGGNKL